MFNGKRYASKFEAKYAMELDMRHRAHEFASWDTQIRMPLVVNGQKICVYVIDFVIYHFDGSVEYVETKGRMTADSRIKIALFKALYLQSHADWRFTLVTK